MSAKIRLDGVTKLFGRGSTGHALEMVRAGEGKDHIQEATGQVVGVADASCEVREGELFVFMGLSGSGKSTLIRCVNRLIEPTAGQVHVDDREITGATKEEVLEFRRRKIGMVFQHFGLFPHRTVLENAGYGLKVQGVPPEERDERAREALELVGLDQWGDYRPENLSGGMQQRVGLARALATDPDILLMDEAFSALDPLIKRQMQNELMQLQEQVHKTILFITHDLNEALRLGDRVAIMKAGRIVQIGTPQQIVTDPADGYVAEFVQDVDQGRVLEVDFVKSQAPVVRLEQATVATARETIRGLETNAVYVVDPSSHPVGLLTNRDLDQAARDGTEDLSTVMHRDFPTTSGEKTLSEVYRLCSEGWPVAVLSSRDGRLEGVINPLDLLDRLGSFEERETDFEPFEAVSPDGEGDDDQEVVRT